MSTPLLDEDILAVRLYCNLDEQMSVNVLYYRFDLISGTLSDLEVLGALAAIMAPLYKAIMPEVAEWGGAGVTVNRAGSWITNQVYDLTDAGPGTVNAHPLPGQIAGLIRKVSNLQGRRAYGRTFVPFPSEAANGNDGKPDSTYITGLTAIATQIAGTGNLDVGGNLFALTGRHRAVMPSTTVAFVGLTQVLPRQTWATLRSRSDQSAANTFPWE